MPSISRANFQVVTDGRLWTCFTMSPHSAIARCWLRICLSTLPPRTFGTPNPPCLVDQAIRSLARNNRCGLVQPFEHAKTCRRSLRLIRWHVKRCLSQCGGTKLEGTACGVHCPTEQAIHTSFEIVCSARCAYICNAQVHNGCRAPRRAETFPKSSFESFPLDERPQGRRD